MKPTLLMWRPGYTGHVEQVLRLTVTVKLCYICQYAESLDERF